MAIQGINLTGKQPATRDPSLSSLYHYQVALSLHKG